MSSPTDTPLSSDLSSNYSRDGAFGARLGMGTRQALVMVDFARAYFDPASPLFANVPAVLPAAKTLLDWARQREMLVCHTRVVYDRQGLNGGVFYRKIPALSAFCEGNPMGDFVDGLLPLENEPVITKQYASAFFGTSLASLLNSQRVDCVIVAGMSTSGCVRATTVDIVQLGYIPIVASDACGDRHAGPHEASLFDLQAKYADVLKVSEIQQALQII